MFLTRTEYDRGVNTFSPEGRLFQVEYAIEAIKLGSTAIGLKTKDGVVLAVEKRITSPLLEPSSVEKIMEIDEHIGCAMSGLIADARTLVEHARVETQNHRFSYGEPMTVESTTQALCDLALRFGEGDEESMSRPFGVSLLIAGHDENGPSLYYTDPSGTFWQCNAKAIGSGSEGADSSLQEQFNKDLTLKEAETIALSILKQVMEEKVTPNNVDIAKVAPTYHLYTPAEVEAVIIRFHPTEPSRTSPFSNFNVDVHVYYRTEYDRGVNTFSPEGRLFQVEYAIEAIKLGSTAIGLKTKDGVVLAVEKRITSPLLEPSSVEKIMEIDEHIGCAMSGLIADARTLVEHARVETQNHRFSYGEPMTVESTTQALCDLALRFGEGDEESMSRPFGVSLLIAGHDENGPSLYYTDPSGTFWQCNAKAIGSGSEGADSSLQEQFNKDLTLKEAETIALSILKQVMEEKVTPNNVDIAKVAPTYHLYTPAEVEAVISRLYGL
ncbi:hypothetical protein SSX86_025849 [Deinandra increscens subsp. villosa]|uniref:Proteasome alpha-type subunits domain-containing protein n=1 Tax=Deinandra increscens subsp. villosa TaxID=3103831 RepID=A0AAP0CIR1_9ASTR